MKVFIFGAGASLGSQGNTNGIETKKRAPLVNNLFEGPYRDYAIDIGVSPAELHDFDSKVKEVGSLEKWLTDEWNGISKIKTEHKKLSKLSTFGRLTFYIWRLCQNVSNTYDHSNAYRIFLKRLTENDEEFGIISFNYDTLLERAYEDVISYSFLDIHRYIRARFIKPHGSVNWLVPKRGDDPILSRMEREIDYKERYKLAASQMFMKELPIKNFQVLPPSHASLNDLSFIAKGGVNLEYFYSLVLLPLTSKLFQNFIGFDMIIEAGKNLMKAASGIYLIGYRAEDEIIKEMFKEVNKMVPVNVVGTNDAQSILEKIMTGYPHLKKGDVYNLGFYNYVNDPNSIFNSCPL